MRTRGICSSRRAVNSNGSGSGLGRAEQAARPRGTRRSRRRHRGPTAAVASKVTAPDRSIFSTRALSSVSNAIQVSSVFSAPAPRGPPPPASTTWRFRVFTPATSPPRSSPSPSNFPSAAPIGALFRACQVQDKFRRYPMAMSTPEFHWSDLQRSPVRALSPSPSLPTFLAPSPNP